MECLENYIGLKNCATSVPESGIYVNILPAINTELVDKIATSEQVNFIGVWENVKSRAFLRLANDVVIKIQEKTDFNDIIYQTQNLIPLSQTLTPVLMGNQYRGVYVRIPTTKYAQYYIDSLQVYSDRTITTNLKVFDVNDGKELHTQGIDLTQGLNTIAVDKYFNLRYGNLELFIGVDCSEFNSIETYEDNYSWCDDECSVIDSFHGMHNYSLQIQAAYVDKPESVIYSNIHRSSQGYGVTLISQVKCSIETFICQNRKQLQQALLYLLGAEILAEKIGSPRLNAFTMSNLENTDYMRKDFESKYYSNLGRAMKVIPLEGEGFCFHCGEQMTVQSGGSMP